MRGTGDASSRRISASTAARSSPTSAATRSLRTRSRVGVPTRPALLRHDAVADLDLSAGGDALDLGHRELVARLDDPGRGDLLVELAQDLAGDRVHDRDTVAPEAQDR